MEKSGKKLKKLDKHYLMYYILGKYRKEDFMEEIKKPEMVQVSIAITLDMKNEIMELSLKRDRSFASMVRILLRDALDARTE